MQTADQSSVARWGLAVLAVVGASAWFVSSIDASDLWWHLAAGRAFLEQGAVPRHDPFSFTSTQPWVNHEWLWGVLAWAAYRIDPQVLAFGNFALLALTFAFVYASALYESERPLPSLLAVWLAASSAHWFFDLRPQVVTLFFVLVIVATRSWSRAPWLWPPLMAAWCNMHAGHVFGLGALGLLVLSYALYAKLAPDSRPARTFVRWGPRAPYVALGLCVLALACNPWGGQLLDFALSYAPGSSRSLYANEIVEWQPFGWDATELRVLGPLWLGTFRGRYLLLLLLALPSVVQLARRDLYPVLLFALSVAMALLARRFVELSSLLCAPLCACTLARLAAPLARLLQRLSSRALRVWLPPLAAACALPWLFHDVRLVPDLFARWTRPEMYPRAALAYLDALGTPVRVFNYELWGGYEQFHQPSTRVFFDGRASTVYSEELYRDYLQLLDGREPIAPLLAKYRLDAVLVPRTHLVDVLLALPAPWKIVYEDDSAIVLLPPDSPALTRALPAPDVLLRDQPQWLRRRAALAFRAGDATGAVAALRHALTQDPFFVPAYTDLMALVASHASMDAVAEIADTARDLLPHRAADFAFHLGVAYEAHGDRVHALAEYRRAVSGHPLASETGLIAVIDKLQK